MKHTGVDVVVWLEVRDILEDALELSPEQRPEFVVRACAGDATLRHEVEHYLRYQDAAEREISVRDCLSAATLAAEEVPDPERVGAYRILRRIGEGGMGVVYLAEREDGEFRQQAALKILKPGPQRNHLLRLFRRERQVLAQLEHPGIARLIDGGTADGQIYYVMEYVDGCPVTAYCNDNRLSLRQRLQLFCAISEAVSYAHRKLIIHRDLKPENILITADGTTKLLDFGLAKAFQESDDGRPAVRTTIGPILTPAYASPEQVRGEHLSTATDIYSLGVLLYELLTGRNPQAQNSRSPIEVCRAILEVQPPPPSRAANRVRDRGIAGDLDDIVLKALRKEPDRRYSSVDEFRADVERYLDGFPVRASRGSIAYRARKFLRRHWWRLAAAAVASLSLIIGLGVSMWEAHVARIQQARAERHFADVRKLANSLLYEIDDKIKDLPGATDARRLMVARAGEYLDDLAAEAAGDTGLNLELAEAYARLGQVQGDPFSPNLGDRSGALASYEKSVHIAEEVLQREPGNTKALEVKVSSLSVEGWLMVAANRLSDASTTQQRAVDASQALVQLHPLEERYRQQLAEQLRDLGDILGNPWYPGLGDIDGADRCYAQSREIWGQSLAHHSPTPEMRLNLVHLYYSMSLLEWEGRGRSAPARGWVEHALEEMREMPASQLSKVEGIYRFGALYAAAAEADSLRSKRQAMEEYNQSIAYERQLKAADPRNTKADEDLSWALILYGAFLGRSPEHRGEALKVLEEAASLASLMPSEELGDTKLEGEAEVRIGELLMQQGRRSEARKHTLAGLAILRRLVKPANAAPHFRGLYAWALLHAAPYDLRAPEIALLHAQAASDAAHGHNVRYLDLVAEAHFQAGRAQQAIAIERQALALLPDPVDRLDYERNLKRFQAALPKTLPQH